MASLEKYQDIEQNIKDIMESVITSFYDKDDLQTKTRFSKNQSIQLIKIRILDKIYKEEFGLNMDLTNLIVKNIEKNNISVKGESRKEFFDMFKNLVSAVIEKSKSLKDTILG